MLLLLLRQGQSIDQAISMLFVMLKELQALPQ